MTDRLPIDERDWSAVWAASGAAGLSGDANREPLGVPSSLVRLTDDAARSIVEHAATLGAPTDGALRDLDGPAMLAERAALAGLSRRGSTSCGGATRLLRAADGWLALSLARDSDVESLPAWLESDDPALARDELERWELVAREVRDRSAAELVERAVLLGLAIGRLGEARDAPPTSRFVHHLGPAPARRSITDLVVIDLASLWAGPLCAQLLGAAGMRVITVESAHRPDGARSGHAAFFDLLHGGDESVCLDFRLARDQRALAALLDRADVVIEGSRPRALAQLGIDAPGTGPQVWVSITGHGRVGAASMRVGFGDDAAVAGGLVTGSPDTPRFCADAVADPLTGMVAAALVLDRLASGGRWLLDLSLARVAASAAVGPLTEVRDRPLAPPRARPALRPTPSLGEHTDAVLREFGVAR